jgi:subtilase family serine protease
MLRGFAKKLAYGVVSSALLLIGSSTAAFAQENAHQQTWKAQITVKPKPFASPQYVSGFTPSQINKAYGLDKLNKTGAGQTIAIVDAYGSPTIAQDLQTFDQEFNLPAANLEIAYPNGKPSTNDPGWALETSLDVEWAHAIAPQAKILLVVAKSSSISDLLSAINYATNSGAKVVSNSWGGSEFSSESYYNSYFNHSGTVYLASSGDSGAGVSWPASSPYVVAVGGTSLHTDASGNYSSESAWSGSGGGLSSYEPRPAFQDPIQQIVGSRRGNPDIAFDADPNTGVAVYDSTKYQGQSGWFIIGGTSLSAPAWAAVIALADEGRATPYSSAQVLNALYSLASGANYTRYFHDITSGNNGGYSARSGYDLVTGWGSPIGDQLVPALNQF